MARLTASRWSASPEVARRSKRGGRRRRLRTDASIRCENKSTAVSKTCANTKENEGREGEGPGWPGCTVRWTFRPRIWRDAELKYEQPGGGGVRDLWGKSVAVMRGTYGARERAKRSTLNRFGWIDSPESNSGTNSAFVADFARRLKTPGVGSTRQRGERSAGCCWVAIRCARDS